MTSLTGFVIIIWAKAKCNHITEQSLTLHSPAAPPVLSFPSQQVSDYIQSTSPSLNPSRPLLHPAVLLGHVQIQRLSSFTIILMHTLFFLIPLSYSTGPKNIPSLGESSHLFSPFLHQGS